MRLRSTRRATTLLLSAGLALLALPALGSVPVLAANTNFLQGDGPPDRTIDMLFYVFLAISILVLVGVGGAILYACFRFRRRSDDEMPKQIRGNAKVERTWLAIPIVILVALFILNVVNVNYLRYGPSSASAAGRDAIAIKVTGQQFYWSFTYPDGKTSIRVLEIPVNTPIDISTISKDVIHGFWVPDLGAKIDALPGITNRAFIEGSVRGVFQGQCYEFCGVGHDQMLITVKVVSMSQYRSYLNHLA